MRKPIQLTGKRFGRWQVISSSDARQGAAAMWWCRCDCGTVRLVSGKSLRKGGSRSCGCLAREMASSLMKKHGMEGTPEYKAWGSMISRCHRPKDISYGRYGGAGVSVCGEWRESFAAFYAHVGPRPGKGFSLDRIDSSRGYEPGNVRWADSTTQNNNRGCVRLVDFNGEVRPIQEWSRALGVPSYAIEYRLRTGIPLDNIKRDFKPRKRRCQTHD